MQNLRSGIFVFLSAALLPAAALFAGDAAAQAAALEEVLVTAEKREQSIQDLPISIEAFEAERLDTLQISGFSDISRHVVGLYDGPNSADAGGVKIYIRGVGTGDPQVGLDSRLALYVDGVYVGKTPGLAFDAVDLERVEVLKGPQGTLYGRNAVAGAINLISRKADPSKFDAKASVTVGNYSAFKVKGHVNIPMGENLAVKLSAYISELDGWVENKGAGEDFAGHEREGARLDIAFMPNDQMRFDYSYEYTESDNQPFFYQSVANVVPPARGLSYTQYLAAPVSGRQDDVNANFGEDVDISEIETEAHTLLGRWDWSDDHYAKLLIGWREVTAKRFNVFWPEVDAECIAGTGPSPATPAGSNNCTPLNTFLNNLFFVGSPARGGTDLLAFIDGAERMAFLDGATLAANSAVGGDSVMDPAESFSIELNQIGTLLDGRLEYTGGLYYFKEEVKNSSEPYPHGVFGALSGNALALGTYLGTYGAVVNGALRMLNTNLAMQTGEAACQGAGGMWTDSPEENMPQCTPLPATTQAAAAQAAARGVPAALNQGRASLVTARNGTNPIEFELDTEAWAIFGQFTYTPEGFDDRLHITVGARYSFDDKQGELQPAFPFPRGTVLPAGVPLGRSTQTNIAKLSGDNDYDSFDPMVRAVWDLDENSIVYASISRGFLSGGYNVALAGAGGFEFDKQNILAYELGFKGDLMDRRLRVNAAVFSYEMDDDQVGDTNPLDPTSREIANVDTSSEGAELSLTWVFSEALQFNLQYAYLDSEVDSFISNYNASSRIQLTPPNVHPVRAENQRSTTGAPENSVNITVDYTAPLMQVLPWLGQEGEFHAHLGYSHKDESFGSNQNPRDQNDIFNAEVSLRIPHDTGTLRVSLWAQNLFDNEYIVDSLVGRVDEDVNLYRCTDSDGAVNQQGPCGTATFVEAQDINASSIGSFGYDAVIYGEPRTWGLTVSYDYE